MKIVKNWGVVKNWDQVYKSLAVWLPILGTALYEGLKSIDPALVPDNLQVPLVAFLGMLGWVIKQPEIRKGAK